MWNQLDLLLDRDVQEAEREFYGLIGLICVRYAHLEKQLTELLRTLIHPDNELLTHYLTHRSPAWKIINLIQHIGRVRHLDDDLLDNLVSEANTLREIRNFYVHGIWEVEVLENERVQALCRKPLNPKRWKEGTATYMILNPFKSETVTLERLKGTAEKLEELSQTVQKIKSEIEEDPEVFL